MNTLNQNLLHDLRNTVSEMKNRVIASIFTEASTIEDNTLLKTLGNGVRFLEASTKKYSKPIEHPLTCRGLLSEINSLTQPQIGHFLDDKILPITAFQIGISGGIDSGDLQHQVNVFEYSPSGR